MSRQADRIFYIYGSIFSNSSHYAQKMLRNWGQRNVFYSVTKHHDEFKKKFLELPKEFPHVYVVENGKEEYIGGYYELKTFLVSRLR